MGDFYKELKQVILPQSYSLHEENYYVIMYYVIIKLYTVHSVNEHSVMSLFKYLYLKKMMPITLFHNHIISQ